MQGEIRLEELVKSFGPDVIAVDGIDLDMPPGEFFTMVGPSGCGKTTTLRMIAGFERPTSGRILLDGEDVAQTPPHRRNVNTVFQSYALFPHLNVADNVAFGLKYKKVTKAERATAVAEALSLVQLTGFEKRKPGQLSGGQQQRVRAGARAHPAAARAAARRAARRARRPPAQGPAGRAEDAAGEPRHHVRVRHPRPGRGAHDERPGRRHERRPGRAERPAAVHLRGARDALRGRLPRRLEPGARGGLRPRRGLLHAEGRRRPDARGAGLDRRARLSQGDDPARARAHRGSGHDRREPPAGPGGAPGLPGQLPRGARASAGRRARDGGAAQRRYRIRPRAGLCGVGAFAGGVAARPAPRGSRRVRAGPPT